MALLGCPRSIPLRTQRANLQDEPLPRPDRMTSAPKGDLVRSRRNNECAVESHTVLRSAPAILPSVPGVYYTKLESRSWPVLMADMLIKAKS